MYIVDNISDKETLRELCGYYQNCWHIDTHFHFLPLLWFEVTILGLEFVVHEAINRGRGEGTSCSIYSQHHNLLTVPTFAFLLPHIFRLSGLPKEKQGEEVSEEGLMKSKVTLRERRPPKTQYDEKKGITVFLIVRFCKRKHCAIWQYYEKNYYFWFQIKVMMLSNTMNCDVS